MFDSGAGAALTGNIVGNIRRIPNVESPQLGNRRDLFVYVPPSYLTSGRHYPVVYMQDGQNLFDAAMSFAGEWHVDTTMERLSHDGVEAIVVGVPNTGVTRAEEYSPFKDPKAGGGRGDDYLRFLVDTVMPLVNEGFRTRRERSHTGILGSSLGGLIGLYALLSRPDDFGFAGAMSPSLWFADRALLRYVEALDGWRGRVYLDTGTGEGRLQVRLAREAARALRRGATRPRLQLRYIEDRDAGHNETAWASRFERAIRWLLPRQRKELNW